MSTRIQKIGLANGVKSKGKSYALCDMIQESYKVSYEAKRMNSKLLINLTESHLANIKKDPTNSKLSEDLDVLKDLVKLGKDQTLKDVEEAEVPKKRRKRKIDSSVKPMTPVKESSWSKSKTSMSKALEGFRESAKSKVFYKELAKFNSSINKKSPITMTEAVKLYKASNSCLTHLTVELEKNPSFRKSYRECTNLLSKDNFKLLEFIQKGKVPSRSLLESFVTFTNILLECDTPEKLDPEIYEDAEIETLDDRDVINEDADLEELDDRDVINEDADLEELDKEDVLDEDADLEELGDRDVINEEDEIVDDEESEDINEDADLEELDGKDVLNEDEEIDPPEDIENTEDLEEGEDVLVDLTPEEINILKSILGKISGDLQETEDIDLVPDEEEVPELNEDDEIIDGEELEEDEDIESIDSEELEEDEDIEDEELEEDDDIEDDEIIDEEDEIDDDELIEEEEEDFDLPLSESAMNRIKKCF